MRIDKEKRAEQVAEVSEEELALINAFTKKNLREDEVFTFSVLLCDNEIDRDFERFTAEALLELQKLFLGKSGIFDHDWSSSKQKARIYRTEVVEEDRPVKGVGRGEKYTYLKAYAYMLRTGSNTELISEIEGGIKREVSVGCSVSETRCSVCGNDIKSAQCAHEPGRQYSGKLCFIELSKPTDAYEWSFVAVPAQKNAGVMKRRGAGRKEGDERPRYFSSSDMDELIKEAQIGRKYVDGLRCEVVRLGMLAGGFESKALESAVGKMDMEELDAFKKAFERTVSGMLPLETQLKPKKTAAPPGGESEFLI